MNRKNLFLDILIFAAFLIASAPTLTGETLHEWLGLAFAGTLIVHLLLHWDWIMRVGGAYFKKLFHSSRLNFLLDVGLFIAFTLVTASGILISRSLAGLVGLPRMESRAWETIHRLSADATVLLSGLHVALHWDWIIAMLRRYLVAPVRNAFTRQDVPAPVTVPVENTREDPRE